MNPHAQVQKSCAMVVASGEFMSVVVTPRPRPQPRSASRNAPPLARYAGFNGSVVMNSIDARDSKRPPGWRPKSNIIRPKARQSSTVEKRPASELSQDLWEETAGAPIAHWRSRFGEAPPRANDSQPHGIRRFARARLNEAAEPLTS